MLHLRKVDRKCSITFQIFFKSNKAPMQTKIGVKYPIAVTSAIVITVIRKTKTYTDCMKETSKNKFFINTNRVFLKLFNIIGNKK